MQNIIGAQLANRQVIDIVIDNNVVKLVGNFEGVIETSSYTIVDRNRQFDFTGGFACSSSDSTKKIDQFVVRRGVVQINTEVIDILIERGFDEAVANCDDWGGRLDFIP